MEDSQLSQFGIILIFIIGGFLFLTLTLFASRLLRPDRPNEEKMASYECGEPAVGSPWGQFNPRFYIIALVFILFEVEILFIFPWATVFGNAKKIQETNGMWGWYSLAEMFLFIGILVLGLAYAWVKGYLNWIKPEPEIINISSPVPHSLYEDINKKYEKVKIRSSQESI